MTILKGTIFKVKLKLNSKHIQNNFQKQRTKQKD